MTIAQQVGRLVREQERDQSAKDFCHVAKCLMLGKGSVFAAIEVAKERRALPRIIETLEKAAVVPGATQSGSWGSPLAPYTQLADAFLASLRNVGVFDAALPSMKQYPMKTQISVTTLGATAASIGEGSAKTISKVELANSQLDPIKAVGIIIVSDELLKEAGLLASNVFAAELSGAVAAETDARFLAEITSGISSITSAGNTAAAILTDIGNAWGSLKINTQSRVFIAADPNTVKLWALVLNATGNFGGLGINGGTLMGCTVIPTDALTNQLVCFDAAQLAANGGTTELDASNQAAIQMDSAPDSPPSASTTITPFWPNNVTGLRAVRWFGIERLGSAAVSKVIGVANSPA